MKNFVIFLFGIVVLSACNKDIEKPQNENEFSRVDGISVKDGRLSFTSLDVFSNLVNEYLSDKNKTNPPIQSKLDKISSLSYVSLLSSQEDIDEKESNISKMSEQNEEDDYDLVPDELFAKLLNDKYEIEVNGVIYKVTQYGTFMLPADKINIINEMLSKEDTTIKFTTDLSSHKFYEKKGNIEGLYDLGNDIYLYDTFCKKNKNKKAIISIPVEKEDLISRMSVDPYDDLRKFAYGNFSFFGPVLQGLFGHNEIHHRSWGRKRRMRVNFYDTNYMVYSALGFSCKFQKKNWIGWSSTKCQEIRCGILALKYHNWSITPQNRPINTGNPQFNNTQAPVISVSNEPFINVDLLGCYDFYVSEGTAAQYAVKHCYDYLKRKLGSSTPPEKNLTYTCWVNADQTRARFFGGKNEKITYNSDGQSYIFSWGTGTITMTWNIGGGSWFPGLGGNIASNIGLEEANVYATCKYDNNWQGIQIVLEK